MLSSGFTVIERIVRDVQGVIAELKKNYFTDKEAFTDDEVLVQKLCVYLEKLLRYGAKEKYTFMGVRKDYWNYISEAISKDETIKFIHSMNEVKTNQGRGRAFLRQALVEKTLADTLQRCIINERLTKDYYVVDSIFRNDSHFKTLLHSLYDLNSVDFALPHRGYDFDRSWPAFSRTNTPKRKTSAGSLASLDQQSPELDPLNILNNVIQRLAKTLCTWRGSTFENSDENNDGFPKLQAMIDCMLFINEDVLKLKSQSENEMISLKKDLMKLRVEKEEMVKNMDSNVKQIHDRYLSLQNSDKTSDHLKDVYEQLRHAEVGLVEIKNENIALKTELNSFKILLSNLEEEKLKLSSENDRLLKDLESIDNKLRNANRAFPRVDNEWKERISIEDQDANLDEHNNILVDKDREDGGVFHLKKKKSWKKSTSKDKKKEMSKKLAETQDELKWTREERDKKENEIASLKNEVDALSKKLDAEWEEEMSSGENKEVNQKLEAEIEEKQKEMELIQNKMEKLELKVDGLNETIRTLNESAIELSQTSTEAIGNSKDSDSDAQQTIKDLKLEVAELNEIIESSNKRVIELTKTNEELRSECERNGSAIKQYSKLESEYESLKPKYTTSQSECDRLSSEMETCRKDFRALQLEYDNFVKTQSLKEEATRKTEETWSTVNEELIHNNSMLENKCKDFEEKLLVSEKELQILKNELAKLAQEKEEDKMAKKTLTNHINNLMEEKKNQEKKFNEETTMLNQENSELKSHMINLTKDKHELWQKSEILEVELKAKGHQRWVNDDEVTHCTHCQELFTVTVRKHHCRLCGHIFCHSCSNRWIKTHHSKKRLRCCNVCADSYEESHPKSKYDIVDGAAIDTLSEGGSFIQEEFEDSTDLRSETSPTQQVDDPFVMLDPENVSSSGSFGPSEDIKLKASDLKKEPIIPAVTQSTQIDDDETVKEKVDITLGAGQRCFVPVVIGGSKLEFVWEFTSSPKDTGFGVAFKRNEEELDEELQTIIPLSRYISHKQNIHGKMLISKPGIYYLLFDNSYSRMLTKYIVCTFILTKNGL